MTFLSVTNKSLLLFILSKNTGITDPDDPKTFPKRVVINFVLLCLFR